jgi:aryl-alcohol dehydrogenase-like predicted oxidoreductase
MEKRRLGRSSLEIAPLVLGSNVFGWTADEPTSFKILDAFLDAGFNCIDTADVYSIFIPGNKGGESETVIGNWLAQGGGRREKVVLATKLGMPMGPDAKGLSRRYMIEAVDASLRRLKSDYIDLYQSHADDPDTPMEETLGAYDELIKAGKVRAIGASNFSPERMTEALDLAEQRELPRYECLQPWYNLYDRGDFEGGNEAISLERGVGVICYFGLASGFLSGKYRTKQDLEGRPRGYRVAYYLNDRGLKILEALDEVAADLSATPAQVALAWLIQRPSITAPIASATSVEQLQDIVQAADLKLSVEQVAQLDRVSAQAPGTPAAGAEQRPGGSDDD